MQFKILGTMSILVFAMYSSLFAQLWSDSGYYMEAGKDAHFVDKTITLTGYGFTNYISSQMFGTCGGGS